MKAGGVIYLSPIVRTHALDRGSYTRKHLSCRNGRSVNGFAAFLTLVFLATHAMRDWRCRATVSICICYSVGSLSA